MSEPSTTQAALHKTRWIAAVPLHRHASSEGAYWPCTRKGVVVVDTYGYVVRDRCGSFTLSFHSERLILQNILVVTVSHTDPLHR